LKRQFVGTDYNNVFQLDAGVAWTDFGPFQIGFDPASPEATPRQVGFVLGLFWHFIGFVLALIGFVLGLFFSPL